ncbi:MAG: cytochrome b/b6 domain-containing protein [Planctomycetes bacterium]|nr:cytochrome b/b6 domain-containing protein [Planctomycetota bacterium]
MGWRSSDRPDAPSGPVSTPKFSIDAARAWSSPLVQVTLALTVFLMATGAYLYFATGSAFAQYSVLAHTVLGLAFLVPYSLYQTRHLLQVWRHPLWYVSVTGYASAVVLAVTLVSGVVLTYQALFTSRIGPSWDFVHTAFGFTVTFLVPLHVVEAALFRSRAARRASAEVGAQEALALRRAAVRTGWVATACGAGLWLLCLVPVFLYSGLDPVGQFPQDYGYKYGANPFTPSLAMTSTGGALNPVALAGSKYCGDSRCHERIVHEWEPSAHRYASRSKFFQIIQKTMADNNGAESTRYCAGCHDLIALFSGAKNIYDEDLSSLGADEGVSCAGCHSITKTDVKGNANYVLTPPQRYLFEESSSPLARQVAGFLIRAYPRQHVASYSRDLLKTPEFCAACHKQFIDKEINRVGWVQLQNQYDNWRKSHWWKASKEDVDKADPRRTATCRECHMRLSDSEDPSAGDAQDYNRSLSDGKHRNHRFIGANQWLPKLHELPGWEEQVRLTEEWLQGKTVIPEIDDKWAPGPAVPIEIIAAESIEAGKEVTVRVVCTSNKVGHDFPTGPLDIIQSWVELTVVDPEGKVIYKSGEVDEKGFIVEGSFMFKAEGVDQAGNLIDRHNLWDMVGARFRRSLFPGFSDTAEYEFACPVALAKVPPPSPERQYAFPAPQEPVELTVKAKLRYRKVDQTLINYLAPGASLTAPITDVSFAEAKVKVVSSGNGKEKV